METLEQIYDEKDRRLTGAEEEAEGRRGALVRLGDAAAKLGAEVDDGGGAPKTGRREEEEAEGQAGEKEMTLRSYL